MALKGEDGPSPVKYYNGARTERKMEAEWKNVDRGSSLRVT